MTYGVSSDTDEIWKLIPGHEEYEVSNKGRVRSLKNNGKILTPIKNPKGYLRIKLCRHSKGFSFLVHRLVGMAFVPGYDESLQINHLNGIPDDNRPENLEWCNGSRNLQHAYDVLGRRPALLGKHHSPETRRKMSLALAGQKRTPEQILRNSISHKGIGLLGNNPRARPTVCEETGQIFSCAKEAAIFYGARPRSVYQSCYKGCISHGFHFHYVNNINREVKNV
ncbi:MAG: HNH endonuclease [Fibrobacter sp.]|nr:HNH endonuclease [Fibrobacter sp.]